MSELVGAVWEFILHRLDSAYLFVASLLALATICGQVLLDDITALSRHSGGLSPTFHTFTVVSEFISGNQSSWIQKTSHWFAERSEFLHPAAVLLLLGAGWVVGRQGSDSLKTKSSATLILSWVLVVNTGGMTFGSWALLIGVFVVASLVPRDGNKPGGEEMVMAVVGVVAAALYSVLVVVFWLIGKTRSQTRSTENHGRLKRGTDNDYLG
ncbi:hypothetical protein [Arthrobacter sp. 3Tela_A]|uniref:hypothetical protein n=1 Tax=Arthrobacter sp. 3Tela_A TaxID=3093743 RepID=UPI003BB5E264